MEYALAQLMKALRYKPESCGFDIGGVIRMFQSLNPSGCTMALGRLSL
jgi:hypothetical protein